MTGWALGIDLGTTWTAAAAARPGRAPSVLGLGTTAPSIPTVVVASSEGAPLVGEAAATRAVVEPTRTARGFKRLVGDPTPLLLGGQPWSIASLLGTVLRDVLARAAVLEGGAPDRVAITHPATWGPHKLDVLRAAATAAGIPAPLLVPEPVAVTTHWVGQGRLAPGEVAAVFDLGGGTFDATVVGVGADGTSMTVLGRPDGVEHLGGLDFDEAVLGHVRSALGEAFDALDPSDPAVAGALVRLRDDCVRAKEALSSDVQASIPVVLPGVVTDIRLSRAELEAMIAPSVDQAVAALRLAMEAAGTPPTRILLAGGSSRIPLIGERLTAAFGLPVVGDAHPKHATCLGAAAIAAAHLADEVQQAPWQPPPEPTPAPSPVPPTQTLPAPPSPVSAGPNGRRWLLAGLAAMLVAVALGIAALGGGGGEGDDETTTEDGFERTEDSTAVADAEVHDPSDVRVQVLNASGVSGSGGTASAALADEGYDTLDAANADDGSVADTVVFFRPGFEADAAAIASTLGLSIEPQPMPSPPPSPAPSDADVVVLLGSDFAATGSPSTITVTIPPAGEAITGETPCPEEDGSSPRTTSFEQAPSGCIDERATYSATIATTMGDIVVELDQAAAPETVNNFVVLARYHFYDGVTFHRIIPGFMIQGGDAVGPVPGSGGPGYTIADELPPASADPADNYAPGTLAMANAGPDTGGSQFFIMATGSQGLDPDYSVFGRVTEGQDVVDAINQRGDSASNGTPTAEVVILSVTITER